MQGITYRQFQDMIRSSKRAWHLELRDSYHVEEEDHPFSKWPHGEPDDFQWLEEWLSFVREVRAYRVTVERLRIVTVPHSDYVEWILSTACLNTDSGEDVRYLPRRETQDVTLPDEDCWLLDDDRLILSLFQPDGRSGGYAVEPDPALTAQYRTVRDQLWPRGIPYSQYVSR
jgi:hypothetical protein